MQEEEMDRSLSEAIIRSTTQPVFSFHQLDQFSLNCGNRNYESRRIRFSDLATSLD